MPEQTSPHFLLVDDDLSWREELGGLLRDQGYRVETAASKQKAMERFEHGEEFDLPSSTSAWMSATRTI
jgi:CheY-like chemotaxis protein